MMRMSVVSNVEKLHSWRGNIMTQPFCKNSWAVSHKDKHTFTYDPEISLLEIYPREMKTYVLTKTYKNTHSRTPGCSVS